MNKTLNNIALLVNYNPNYKSIEKKLDFGGLQNEPHYKTTVRKSFKIAIPISIVCTGLALTAVLVPTLSNTQKYNQQEDSLFVEDSPFAFVNGSIRVLKKHYVGGQVSSLPSGTTESIETNEDIIKKSYGSSEVTKVNTWEGFKKYTPYIPGYVRDDFKGIIDESTFVENCVLSIKYTCNCTQISTNYDGRGVVIENMQATNGDLFIQISVPTKGADEGITFVVFIAIASKDDIKDDFEYSYEVAERLDIEWI